MLSEAMCSFEASSAPSAGCCALAVLKPRVASRGARSFHGAAHAHARPPASSLPALLLVPMLHKHVTTACSNDRSSLCLSHAEWRCWPASCPQGLASHPQEPPLQPILTGMPSTVPSVRASPCFAS